MVPVRQNAWTDRRMDGMDVNYIPLTSSRDNSHGRWSPNDNLCLCFNYKSAQLFLTRFFLKESPMLTWVI